jgi:hypothetical protein
MPRHQCQVGLAMGDREENPLTIGPPLGYVIGKSWEDAARIATHGYCNSGSQERLISKGRSCLHDLPTFDVRRFWLSPSSHRTRIRRRWWPCWIVW